jgi:hypothetical protein
MITTTRPHAELEFPELDFPELDFPGVARAILSTYRLERAC